MFQKKVLPLRLKRLLQIAMKKIKIVVRAWPHC